MFRQSTYFYTINLFIECLPEIKLVYNCRHFHHHHSIVRSLKATNRARKRFIFVDYDFINFSFLFLIHRWIVNVCTLEHILNDNLVRSALFFQYKYNDADLLYLSLYMRLGNGFWMKYEWYCWQLYRMMMIYWFSSHSCNFRVSFCASLFSLSCDTSPFFCLAVSWWWLCSVGDEINCNYLFD